jgi:uncharacterized alkaline shock family protein YloU
MNLFDRIILMLYVLFFSVVSVIVILFSTSLITLDVFWTSISQFHGRWEVAVVGVVLLLASLRLLLSGIKFQRSAETIIKNNDNGIISISFNALENLVLKIVRDVESVKDVKVKIKKHEHEISIFLNIVVTHDIMIPELTLELQEKVKSYIQTTAGVNVKDIRINVDNIFNPLAKGLKSKR